MSWEVVMHNFAIAPQALIAFCQRGGHSTSAGTLAANDAADERIPVGRRNAELFKRACVLRRAGMQEEEIGVALHSLNLRLCETALDVNEVRKIARSAANQASPVPSDVPQSSRAERRAFNLKANTADRLFAGTPKQVGWLVHRVFPRGKVVVVASPPGVGKSMLALYLALQLTLPPGPTAFDDVRVCFGGRVESRGCTVIISAEDDLEEMHRRLHALAGGRPMPERLHVASLPDQGHLCVIEGDPRKGMQATAAWLALKEEILGLDEVVLIVVDTLQAVSTGDLNAAEIAQSMMNEFTDLAARTGATVMVLHHFNKDKATDKGGPMAGSNAMDAIRGSSAIVGSARAAYGLYPHPHGREVCEKLGRDYAENSVVVGRIVKANGDARRDETIYIRNEAGLLEDCTHEFLRLQRDDNALLEQELLDEIAKAYGEGKPYAASSTSVNGLHKRRHDMPLQFNDLSAKWFAEHAKALMNAGKVKLIRIGPGSQYIPADATPAETSDAKAIGTEESTVQGKRAVDKKTAKRTKARQTGGRE
ncbi:hypothetical protein E4K72_15290 [Oxalobacteraceae bacterium OM1]|nr:hypothetical protein E4K72_15290 [Oxalobacteraceae bacterium OM1]